MSSISVSSIIDQSWTMVDFGYIEPAKTDAATFITIMKASDQIGVVAFSTVSKVIYPLTTIQSDHKAIDAALNEIKKIQGINMTNIKQAISQGHGMLTAAANPAKAMLLLTDGLWNEGGDPLVGLPTDIPIHTIALGNNGQLSFLQTVANRTGGKYHFSPDAFDLAEIYNQIANDANVARTAINQKQQIQSYYFKTLPLQVPANSDHVSLAVNWLDESISYTSGTPGKNQVNVLLKDPAGQKVVMPPTFSGKGFVTFHLHDPKPGQWTVGCWCGDIAQNIFKGTVGAFEPNSSIALNCEVMQTTIKSGEPFDLKTNLDTGKEEANNIVVNTSLESPIHSKEHILEKFKNEIKNIAPDEKLLEKGMSEQDAKLEALHKKLLPHIDIFARKQTPVNANYFDGEIKHESLKPDVLGSHTVRINVEGYLPKSSTKFSRTARLSVHVE